MQKFLIGSRAIKFNKHIEGTKYKKRFKKLNDIDYAYDGDEYVVEDAGIGCKIEYHPMKELFEFDLKSYPINDILLSIKLSHSIYDIFHEKTLFDIDLLKYLGAKPIPGIVDRLSDKWKTTHKRNYRGFDFPHEELFKDNVDRLIHHNELHKIVSQMIRGSPVPMYQKLLNEKRLSSPSSWNDEEFKFVNTEEALVFVIERYNRKVIQDKGILPSYISALKDLITRCSPPEVAMEMSYRYSELRDIDKSIMDRFYNLIISIYGSRNI